MESNLLMPPSKRPKAIRTVAALLERPPAPRAAKGSWRSLVATETAAGHPTALSWRKSFSERSRNCPSCWEDIE